jgi:uncharacterized protein YbbC (DUF1343 family)
VRTGLDRLATQPALVGRLRGARVGLLTHPAAVDADMRHASDVLAALGIAPVVYFGPEHGYGGEAQYMEGVAGATHPGGAPIVSLYGDRYQDLSPRAEHLAAIDVLVIDLADVGARYYTFVWTALLALRAAAAIGVHVVLLDRPNPIGGAAWSVEGATQRQGFLSFVGLEPMPIRHAMTPGEVLVTYAGRDGLPLGDHGALRVLAVQGWDRERSASAWDRAFVMPSPNMPTADTALVYPGGCLLEGVNLSEGRGTTRPFELVGAPWLDARALADSLRALQLPGVAFRPASFRPTFQKFAGETCSGVQVHPTDARTFRPVATYVAICALAHRQRPDRFAFRTEPYEFVDDIPAFDLLTGSSLAREAILANEDPRAIAESLSLADAGWSAVITAAAAAIHASDG